MLPTGDGQTSRRRNNNQNGMKWLRNENLTTQPQEAKILMVRYIEEGRFGPNIQLKLAFSGDIWYMSIPAIKKDPRYKLLIDEFGADENDWVDQRILLYLEKDKFTEGYLNRLAIPGAAKKGK